MKKYIPTGNEMISLPKINEATAGIEDFTFLSMQHKGMIEVRGTEEAPLIKPFFMVNNQPMPLTYIRWHRDHYWLPVMNAQAGSLSVSMTILPPIRERGFAVKLTMSSAESVSVRWGLEGCWASNWHCVNEDKELSGTMNCYKSGWNSGVIFDYSCGYPMFAFAPMSDRNSEVMYTKSESGINYSLFCEEKLVPGETACLVFYWGLGFEEVAAATSAKEMLRQGWDSEYTRTCRWLEQRSRTLHTAKFTDLYNTNLFFCIFYSTGLTLDTEEFICATSRSTRYYVSAAYWDRDVLFWAFPAILETDPSIAREILDYVFGRQRKNLGIHSRFIDGTVLEPGFELDELMAPVIALTSYVRRTGDRVILEESNIKAGISLILERLDQYRHPEISLYETFLQPTDDEIVHPYLTYDNMLVWHAFEDLAWCYPDTYRHLHEEAERVKQAIYKYCVFKDAHGMSYFGWSTDLNGRHDIYDEPPGSLQLLPYYGFCSDKDEIWRNTVSMIRSADYTYSFAEMPIAEIGCPHAPYPWILSLGNSMLSGHALQAWKELEIMEMDNNIACESVDPVKGICTTGAAFATCAGFLCHCMITAYKEGIYAK